MKNINKLNNDELVSLYMEVRDEFINTKSESKKETSLYNEFIILFEELNKRKISIDTLFAKKEMALDMQVNSVTTLKIANEIDEDEETGTMDIDIHLKVGDIVKVEEIDNIISKDYFSDNEYYFKDLYTDNEMNYKRRLENILEDKEWSECLGEKSSLVIKFKVVSEKKTTIKITSIYIK